MILNQKPSHIEVKGIGIKSYICIKNQLQYNFWNGKPYNKRLASHLLTLQNITNKIIHEGEPLHKFESDYLREPFFNWNPPSRNTLTAICKDNVDDDYDMDKHVIPTQNDNDSFDEENSQTVVDTGRPAGEVPRVIDDINRDDTNGHDMDEHVLQIHNDCNSFNEEDSQVVDNNDRPAGVVPRVVMNNSYNDLEAIPQIVVAQNGNKGSAGAIPQSLDVVSPLNELILKQFTNNYHLIAQKQSDTEVGLVIRALL